MLWIFRSDGQRDWHVPAMMNSNLWRSESSLWRDSQLSFFWGARWPRLVCDSFVHWSCEEALCSWCWVWGKTRAAWNLRVGVGQNLRVCERWWSSVQGVSVNFVCGGTMFVNFLRLMLQSQGFRLRVLRNVLWVRSDGRWDRHVPAMMNSNLGDPNLQCGEVVNFRSFEGHRDRGWFVIGSFIGVSRKQKVLGAQNGQDKSSRLTQMWVYSVSFYMTWRVVVGPNT